MFKKSACFLASICKNVNFLIQSANQSGAMKQVRFNALQMCTCNFFSNLSELFVSSEAEHDVKSVGNGCTLSHDHKDLKSHCCDLSLNCPNNVMMLLRHFLPMFIVITRSPDRHYTVYSRNRLGLLDGTLLLH